MPVSPSPFALVADIGGTNARFALAQRTVGGGRAPLLAEVRQYKAAEFPAFADALRQYREEAGAAAGVPHAVFAVATAILGDQVRLTNSPWRFSIEETRRAFGLSCLAVINDFQAIGHAVPFLRPDALAPLGPGAPSLGAEQSAVAVLGPGTGLGACLLAVREGRPLIFPSEAGHIGFAPSDELEIEVLRVLRARHGRVSNERIISGPGLSALHDALAVVEGGQPPELPPEEITAAASAAPSGAESRTLRLFCSIYGGIAGDMVLALGAWDGVFLVGKLSRLLLPALREGGFRQRFEDKGRFGAAMRRVPCAVATTRRIGLLGAAVYAATALGKVRKND